MNLPFKTRIVRPFVLAAITLVATISCPTQSVASEAQSKITIAFPDNSLREVLLFYSVLTGRTTVLTSEFEENHISIVAEQPITNDQAVQLIKDTLRTKYSIILTDEPELVTKVSRK